MILPSGSENEKFVRVFGSPFKSFCGIISLKYGVIIIAGFDLMYGVLGFVQVISSIVTVFSSDDHKVIVFLHCCYNLLLTIGIPFALAGIKGMNSNSIQEISKYSEFRIVEMFITFGLSAANIATRSILKIFRKGVAELILLNVILTLFVVLTTKVIWSADVRLKHNETVLVMYGEDAVKLMRVQPGNLPSPEIESNYFAPSISS